MHTFVGGTLELLTFSNMNHHSFARIYCTDDIVIIVTDCYLYTCMYTGIAYLLKCEPSQCISIVILIMLIIVTVSSQDTALYYSLHSMHCCYCSQGLKYLPFFFLNRH